MAEQTNPTLDRAELLIQEGNLREARLLLVELLKASPTSAPVWWAMSRAVEAENRVIDCLERTLRYDPGHEQAREHLQKLQNPPSPAVDSPAGETQEEPIPSQAVEEVLGEKETKLFTWEQGSEEAPGVSSPEQPAWEVPGELPVIPDEKENSSSAISTAPGNTAVREMDFVPGGSATPEAEFDLFAPDAFEKYNAERNAAIAPSEIARPWVEQLVQSLNSAEEPEPVGQSEAEIPSWAVPPHDIPPLEASQPIEMDSKGHMSTLEIILLIVLVILVLLVGGYFALTLLGII